MITKYFKYVLCIYCLICVTLLGLNSKAVASNQKNQKSITIRIPKDSPKLNLLEKNFVLVPEKNLPKEYLNIHDNWQEILANHNQNVFALDNIPLPAQHKQQWANLSKMLSNTDNISKLRNINGFFNSIPSQKDAYNYKEKEYWATPQEFLQRRAGDCEDYAIAKYFALQYFNWPKDKLWIVFLRDNINAGLHVVLATKTANKGFILDNLSKPAQLLIPEQQYAKQVLIIAVLNQQGMWLPIKN